MYLKKLTENRMLTIDYFSNGVVKTIQGRVYRLNLMEQVVSLKDEKQKLYRIQLSSIRNIQ